MTELLEQQIIKISDVIKLQNRLLKEKLFLVHGNWFYLYLFANRNKNTRRTKIRSTNFVI